MFVIDSFSFFSFSVRRQLPLSSDHSFMNDTTKDHPWGDGLLLRCPFCQRCPYFFKIFWMRSVGLNKSLID
jgi:hypothetical protein